MTSKATLPDADGAGEPNVREPVYARYTLDRYNASLRSLIGLKRWYGAITLVLMCVTAYFFVGVREPTSIAGAILQWLTVVWLLPIPLLIFATIVYYTWFRYDRFALHPTAQPPLASPPTVIFQITSTGINVETVLNTARSAVYWTQRHPEVCYRPEVWLIVEGWGYAPNRERLDVLTKEGVRIVVTPVEYRTLKGTTRKGRALQYATERRAELGIPLDRLWIYHQDDETAVGEDTILGIDEYVRTHLNEKSVGCGIILYSQHAEDFRPSQIQEFSRTKDDIRTIFTITSRHNMFSGFHGSHYLARGDLEDETGWDVGPDMNSEDLIFETRVRAQHGPVFHPLKGFAHEQAALTIRDQLTQRRRWFQGWWRAVLHQPFALSRRIVMSYGMIVWMAAIFSLAAMLGSWIFGFTAIFVYTGALTGYVWATMVIGYHKGYVLHRAYLGPRTVPLVRIVLNGIAGSMADAVAPWYGTFTRRPRAFQVISKDRSSPAPASGPLGTPRLAH
jgi:egghead protein (zeste-white 4 protein)